MDFSNTLEEVPLNLLTIFVVSSKLVGFFFSVVVGLVQEMLRNA